MLRLNIDILYLILIHLYTCKIDGTQYKQIITSPMHNLVVCWCKQKYFVHSVISVTIQSEIFCVPSNQKYFMYLLICVHKQSRILCVLIYLCTQAIRSNLCADFYLCIQAIRNTLYIKLSVYPSNQEQAHRNIVYPSNWKYLVYFVPHVDRMWHKVTLM